VLHSSPYAAIRRLHCEVTEAVVFVYGVVPSYFLKQVAQTLLKQLEGILNVSNMVEVRGGQAAANEDRSVGDVERAKGT